MKALHCRVLVTWGFLMVLGLCCGPFFPDTVLDQPRAALDVPPVSYLAGLYDYAGKELPADGDGFPQAGDNSFVDQIPLELVELRGVWSAAGVEEDEIFKRSEFYREVRGKQLSIILAGSKMELAMKAGAELDLPEKPLGADFPGEVADYVEAARLHAIGKKDEARGLWQAILERPLEGKRLRSLWSAWMMAKTSANAEECAKWYSRVETEAVLGGTDVLQLRYAAKAWLASMEKDPIVSAHLYFESFQSGKKDSALDLRRVTGQILFSDDKEILAKAARDPLVRTLVNLDLHASLDGPLRKSYEPDPKKSRDWLWLSALQELDAQNIEDAERVSWALYSAGRYEEAEKWLTLAEPTRPLSMWLLAKFDLRNGDLDAAAKHLSEAIRIESQEKSWQPENPSDDGGRWYPDANDIRKHGQSRLLADAGIVSLAREDYLQAFDLLREGGYWEDAAYLAERVISTDGLMKHIRTLAPEWTPVPQEQGGEPETVDPATCLKNRENFHFAGIGEKNKMRYLLSRRLAREYRFDDALEFMPPALVPLMEHYVSLHRARLSGKYSGEELAAITWRQALIHRHLGAELFSTEGAPDGAARGWSFTSSEFAGARAYADGWERYWETHLDYRESDDPERSPIPAITSDELARIKRSQMPHEERFHYRYRAAELAWDAGKALPANHPMLARLYNTAGQWISINDPKEADRFYQAMVRRCAGTEEGKAADAKRWFLSDLPSLGDLPSLPNKFDMRKDI